MDKALFRLHAGLEDRHWWFTARREIVAAVLARYVPPGRGSLVVEIGCGTGGNLRALRGRYAVAGMDASPEAVAEARRLAPEITALTGDSPRHIAEYAEDAAAFLLLDVLEHVADDAGFARSLMEVMPEGSVCLVTVPAGMELWSGHDAAYGHYRRYTPEGLAQTFAGLPVRREMLSHFNSRLYPAIRLIRALNNLSGREGADLSMPPGFVNRTLTRVFRGEAGRLLAVADSRAKAYAVGASIMAVFRRTAG